LQVIDGAEIRKEWKMSGEHWADRTGLAKQKEVFGRNSGHVNDFLAI
jgi:hypothetical protein